MRRLGIFEPFYNTLRFSFTHVNLGANGWIKNRR